MNMWRRAFIPFALLILPVSSLPAWIARCLSCERRAAQEVLPLFTSSLEDCGLQNSDLIRRISQDLREGGVLREPSDPVAYAVIGGGEWGPRAVARALLDSLYVAWERDTVLLDMEEAVRLHRSSGLEEAQMWLKENVVKAIERCPQKAAVVLDNVHLLTGRDVLLLDPLLLLLDSTLSQIEFEGRKVSGAGSLFLLLLNEKDESSAGTAGLSGKDRLQQAWEYHIDNAFTPRALIGRIDAAFVLPAAPRLSTSDQFALQDDWLRAGQSLNKSKASSLHAVVGEALARIDKGILRVAASLVAGIATASLACWALSGCFGDSGDEFNPRGGGNTGGTNINSVDSVSRGGDATNGWGLKSLKRVVAGGGGRGNVNGCRGAMKSVAVTGTASIDTPTAVRVDEEYQCSSGGDISGDVGDVTPSTPTPTDVRPTSAHQGPSDDDVSGDETPSAPASAPTDNRPRTRAWAKEHPRDHMGY